MKKFLIAAIFLGCGISASAQQVYWKPLNGMLDGSINGITCDSNNNIYVETGGDGVLRSTDHGRTWQGFNRGLRVLPFYMLASSTVELDTSGKYVAYVYGLSQRGEVMRRLFNSVSSDTHWEYLDNIIHQDGAYSATAAVRQIMTNRKGYLYLGTINFGIIRSRDRGLTFDTLPSLRAPVPDSFIYCMALDRRNQDIYAVSHGKDSVSYLSRSTDDGTTWTRLANSSILPFAPLINQILIADDGSILLGYIHNTLDWGSLTRIYRSTDMGKTWDSVLRLPPLKESDVDALVAAPNSHKIYANVHGPTFVSTDYGATWNMGNPDKMGEETFHVVIDKEGRIFQCAIPDGVFLLTDTTIAGRADTLTYRNTDSGIVVPGKPSIGPLAVQHMDGGILVNHEGTIFACSQFNMYRSYNQGRDWDNLPNELDEAITPFFSTDSKNRLFYGSYWGLFRSTDSGNHFDTVINSKPGALLSYNRQNQVLYHGINAKDEIFVSCQKNEKGDPSDHPWFLRSKDHGDHWQWLNNATQFGMDQTEEVGCFDFSPATGDTIYAALASSAKIYRSTNDGDNWTVVCTDSALTASVLQIIVHPDGSVFRLQGGSDVDTSNGVYRSTDGGVHWTHLFPSDSLVIPHYSFVKPMLLDRRGRILVCGFDWGPGDNVAVNPHWGVPDTLSNSGIYISDNADFTKWKNVSMGLVGDDWFTDRYLNCSQIAQDFSTGLYYANSRGKSVFVGTRDLEFFWDAVPATPLPVSIAEPRNYPNPFRETTQIVVDILHSGNVRVSLCDVMGRTLQVVADGYMEQGQHTLPFRAGAALSSGEYMLVLESSGERTSHWMTVTK